MASSRLVLPAPVGPWMRKSPSAESASTSTTTRSANGPKASISSRCSLTRRPPPRRPDALVVADLARRPGWPRRPRRAAPARRRWRRARRARGRGSRSRPRRRSAVATRAAYGRSGTGAPCGSKRSSRVCGNRRRTWSIAPSGRSGSVSVTWHQARLGGAVRGVGEQVVEGAAQHGAAAAGPVPRRARPPGCRRTRSTSQAALAVRPLARTTSPRASRCSARPARPPGGRAGDRARRSRRRRTPRAARRTTPPTLMSRSESLVTPPVTKAWAMTTVRPPRWPSVGAHPRHRGAQHAGVGALGGAQGVGGQGRLEVGQGVDGACRRAAPAGRRRRPTCAGAARPARAAATRTRAGWRSRGCRC